MNKETFRLHLWSSLVTRFVHHFPQSVKDTTVDSDDLSMNTAGRMKLVPFA